MFETLVRLRLTSVFYVREAIKKVVNFQCRVEVELNGGGGLVIKIFKCNWDSSLTEVILNLRFCYLPGRASATYTGASATYTGASATYTGASATYWGSNENTAKLSQFG